jgi:hypothetical protein
MIAIFSATVFLSFLPVFQTFFNSILKADVYNQSDQIVKTEKKNAPLLRPNYLSTWFIDVNHGEDNAIMYEFNPLLSISLPSIIAGIMIAVLFSTMMPGKIAYMRSKILREIDIQLHKISNYRNIGETHIQLRNEISSLDIDSLKKSADSWGVTVEDISILKNAIKWAKETNFFKRLISLNDGLSMYMRFHFTYKYSNIVLGFVYIGAAVLIIIVGLRGLKFIPVTMPSLILFSLSLEFSLLVTYAITIMYGRQEEEQERQMSSEVTLSMTGTDFGSNKDIENFLRIFIKNNEPGDKE